jgi:hypothetical protein
MEMGENDEFVNVDSLFFLQFFNITGVLFSNLFFMIWFFFIQIGVTCLPHVQSLLHFFMLGVQYLFFFSLADVSSRKLRGKKKLTHVNFFFFFFF